MKVKKCTVYTYQHIHYHIIIISSHLSSQFEAFSGLVLVLLWHHNNDITLRLRLIFMLVDHNTIIRREYVFTKPEEAKATKARIFCTMTSERERRRKSDKFFPFSFLPFFHFTDAIR